MFTGLIQDIGTVVGHSFNSDGIKLKIKHSNFEGIIQVDDSIAVNGVCQTVESCDGKVIEVQVIHTTVNKSTLGYLKVGSHVNLELAMRPIDRLGGHIVQGHVNSIGVIQGIHKYDRSYEMTIQISKDILKYTINEGSICIDGISLTIANVDKCKSWVKMSIIPHTWMHTILKEKKIGDKVNIEVDIIAKYVENLLLNVDKGTSYSEKELSFEWIKSKGF